MNFCIACSMPLSNPSDVGAQTENGDACIHCVNSEGQIKSCEEIFEGGVQFFLSIVAGGDRALAERLVCKNMCQLPYWKEKACECLKGEQATDEEFQDAMAKLANQKHE